MSGPLTRLKIDAKYVVKICQKIMIEKRFLLTKTASTFGVPWEQKDSIFSPKGLWTYLSWLIDPTLAFLVLRLFNLLSLVGGILQEEC